MTEQHSISPAGLSQSEIEEKAEEVLRRHKISSFPVDPVLLANEEGLKVHNAKFSEEDISGMLARREGGVLILVNNEDGNSRKRFTIAHELGHYFMHADITDEHLDSPLDLMRDQESCEGVRLAEVEANRFAAALLMPALEVENVYKEVASVRECADYFDVSEVAMGFRLKTLGF